ncbi:MAG: polyribonucleotide nucleotidyltransferase [Anaerolineae bacterium]|jgi:polyribonucleotide nucleotidyltransferase|nr:polyribonucleotide nucleotidyltransferase [Anaerolineae bacterium]MDH7472428.1 polyribonucleotide nucleotidyltransferase [Anaerolineae bacterium]
MSQQFSAAIGKYSISFETGKLAGQAGGAVTVSCGDTVLLATATMAHAPRENGDFFPLTVDYEERLYAAGRIPGSFFRREGRPSEGAILICRLVDRPIRPLFPKDLRNDVQVIVTALSHDQEHQLDILAILGASAALTISDIPFGGPVGAVRVGYVDGQFIFNPTFSEMEHSTLDLRLAGTADAVLMVEAGANEVSEDLMVAAIKAGHEAMQPIIALQEEMRRAVGKPKREYKSFTVSEEVKAAVAARLNGRLRQVLVENPVKTERNEALEALQDEVVAALAEQYPASDVKTVFYDLLRDEVRRRILEEGIRPDGRDLKAIRPISCETHLLPRAHGSGLFTRGQTQVLTIATLGTPREEQQLDTLSPEESKRYMHHYNFPPYSTGEVRPLRGTSRREIGHGALAERALLPVLPSEEEFPYTIRLVSEVLSSNGSTSMASVCGSTLALMDTGVPIKAPVSGVAMGLIKEGDDYRILTDIQGLEDFMGDMDFKVAGTRQGITALQMDIKIKGISYEIMAEALAQAREARNFILDRMLEAMPAVRPELSPYAPRITIIHIDPEKIGTVIGPGGKTIRGIQETTGAKIDIEEDGSVYIASTDGPSAKRAQEMIEALVEEAQIGKIYTGKVVRTTDFGAFVEILPGQDGMVHISQLADYRVPSVEDVVHVGDEIMVMVTDIDSEGKIRLSRQAVLEGWTPEEARARDLANRTKRNSSGSGGKRRPEGRSRSDQGRRSYGRKRE